MTSAVRPAPPAIELRKRAEGFPLGNPGNGRQPIGDEYNWEALLAEVPATEDLHIVSGYRDYASSGNPTPRRILLLFCPPKVPFSYGSREQAAISQPPSEANFLRRLGNLAHPTGFEPVTSAFGGQKPVPNFC